MAAPIGTFLSKVQYAQSQGKLSDAKMDDTAQPFHFAALKATVEHEDDEFMLFQVSTYQNIRSLCGCFHALFIQYREMLGEEPSVLESNGFRAAFRYSKQWDAILILITSYRFPDSYLFSLICEISYVLSSLFPGPSYKSAQFVQKSLIFFSKTMNTVEGVPSVLSNYKVQAPKGKASLAETDTALTEVGALRIVSDAVSNDEIFSECAVFVYGRLLFTTMGDPNLQISQLLVANQTQTTEEFQTVDGKIFCLARHYDTVMVSVTEQKNSNSGLERCCLMQAALMRLDASNLIRKMQASFAKILPPQGALDVFVVSGSLTVSQPPFIGAPLFAQRSNNLEAIAAAALMYESLTHPGLRAVVSYKIDEKTYTAHYVKQGDSMTFTMSGTPIDEKEVMPLPNLLKNCRR